MRVGGEIVEVRSMGGKVMDSTIGKVEEGIRRHYRWEVGAGEIVDKALIIMRSVKK